MSRNIKIFLAVIILVLIIYPFAKRGYEMHQYSRAVSQITLSGKDISEVEDGIYEGKYDAVLVKAKVIVHMIDGEIQDIEYEHIHERGARGEQVIENVLEEQSLQVDTITGATDSSLVLLKAIDKALFD
ncbi:FMN-binding protein [Tindallia californiensis]|uniref:FMN-binding domain-containing protein n=1 Tax=Tindallia californiensis TaxID=159292 RepID=A0A1H3JNN7_9FIRM|nr:FMN-binding protein [Tindallia californiensis]SDY40884.1 FMN-binding domain-containing protein [Tindallia californiensis]